MVQHLPDDRDAPVELEDVFLYFWNKFALLTAPRSVAEARITQSEMDFLVRWFSALYGKPRNWCETDWQDNLTGGVSASRQEMFGSLFLIFASETCRDQCNEDALWPGIASVFRRDKITYPLLFVGGQPTVMTKSAIIAGARRLCLRNLIDRYGTQEYFDTLKLQFGFTHKGALSRLPEWLDGLSTPVAVQILRGDEPQYEDLRSESFCKLWRLLVDFRRKRISADDLSVRLPDSPWIRPSWTSELLSTVEKRPIKVPLVPGESAGENSYIEPICVPGIEWQSSVRPRLVLRLNEDKVSELLADANSATFAVDGRIIARWIAHEGVWIGPRTIPCDPEGIGAKPSFSPKILSISSGEGASIVDCDLTESELGEPFLLFDSETGSVVSTSARLNPRRDYALVCDPDLTLTGCFSLPAKGRSIYKLTAPWDPQLKLLWNGILHWEPKISDAVPISSLRMILSNPQGKTTNIGGDCTLILKNVPDDVDLVDVVVGAKEYATKKTELGWETMKRVSISLKLALGEERVRVRLVRGAVMRSSSPRIELRLTGLAIIDINSADDPHREWNLVNGRRPLNIAGGSSRARIFSDISHQNVYEGPRFVRRLDVRGLSLRDLWGWGWPLLLRSSDGNETILVDSLQDRGCISIYFGTLLGKPVNRLHLRIPIEPSPEHSVLAWRSLGSMPTQISADQIRADDHNYVWKLPSFGAFVAIALSYKGVWLGSSVKTDSVANALARAPTARLFSLVRWLRQPVIASDLRDFMRKAVAQAPTEFVKGWSGNEPPGNGLIHRQADPSLESILRWFLWEYPDNSELRLDRIAAELIGPSTRNQNQFLDRLGKLCELCPALAYKFARAKVRGSKYWQYTRRVIAQLLALPQQATLSELRMRMVTTSRQCSEASRISPYGLTEAMELYRCHLDNGEPLQSEIESQIRRLGELSIGREYLSTSLVLRLLEQRNP